MDEKEGRLEPLKAELDTLKKKLDKVDKLQFNETAAIKVPWILICQSVYCVMRISLVIFFSLVFSL